MPYTYAKGLILAGPENISVEQNQGLAWSSDSNLWENQLFKKKKVLDKTKVLHGLRTQTYGEINYFKKKVLDRTKVLHGSRTQTYKETRHFKKI